MSKSKPTNEECSKVLKLMGKEIRSGRSPEETLYVLSTGNFKVVRIDGCPDDDYSRRWEIKKVSSFPSKPLKKKVIVYDEFEEVVDSYPVKTRSNTKALTPASLIMMAGEEIKRSKYGYIPYL